MNKSSEYEDYNSTAKVYDRFRQAAGLRQILSYIESLKVDKPRILEIGCGTGNYLHSIAKENPSYELTGLDLNAEMLDCCRTKTLGLSNVKELINGTALELPFGENSFDVVLAMQTVHHFGEDQNRRLFFKEACRVLRPNGILILNHMTPVQNSFYWFIFLCPYANEKSADIFRSNAFYCNMAESNGLKLTNEDLVKENILKEEFCNDPRNFLKEESRMSHSSFRNFTNEHERAYFKQLVQFLVEEDKGNIFCQMFKKLGDEYGMSTNLVFSKISK